MEQKVEVIIMQANQDFGEQVRLPGIINMDLEATKIRTGDKVSVICVYIYIKLEIKKIKSHKINY